MATRSEILDFFEEVKLDFGFYSQVFFKELTHDAIEEIANIDFPTETGNANLDEGYRLVKRYFNFADSDARTQLACEYSRIFLAAGVFTKSEVTAVPYESVFVSEEHIVMQDARDQVVATYLADGFAVNKDLHEPEDHLAIEFEFVSSMCGKCRELLEQNHAEDFLAHVARLKSFIDNHILNWIFDLQRVAKDFAKTTFYTGMLLVAAGTCETVSDMLGQILENVHA